MKLLVDFTKIQYPDEFLSSKKAHEYSKSVLRAWLSGAFQAEDDDDDSAIIGNIVYFLNQMKVEDLSELMADVKFNDEKWECINEYLNEHLGSGKDIILATTYAIAEDVLRNPTSYSIQGNNLI